MARAVLGARGRPGVVLAVASIGVFMAFVDETVVAIAFPNMVRSFHGARLSELSWVLNAYNIAFAALMVPAGRFADQLGRRRMYVTGIVLFTLSSAAAAAAPSLLLLVVARAVQGLGAAVIVPASLAIVLHRYPSERRAQAVAIWSAAAALAAGIGPSIGGGLVNADSWRLVFLVNLPIGAIAIWLARTQLVQSRAPGERQPSDLGGALLLAAAVGALTLAIVQGPSWGWASAGVIVAGVASVLGAAALVRHARRRPGSVIDLELVRTPGFPVTNLLTVIGAAGFFSLGLANVLFMIQVWRYSALTTGLATTPAPFAAAVAAGVAGQLATRLDGRRLVLVGAGIWTAGPLFLLARAGDHANYLGAYLPAALMSAIGIGFAFPLVADAAVAMAPRGRYAGATALNGAIRQLGAAIGVAILAALLGHSVRAGTVHPYHAAWIFAAGCFAIVALGSFLLAPIGVADLGDDAELERRRAALRPSWRPAIPARRPPRATAIAPVEIDDRTLLAELPMFAALGDDALGALAAQCDTVRLAAGEWLLHQGDAADALYVVRHGRLEVFHTRPDGTVDRLHELGRGAVVGELALLTAGTRSASIRARRDTSLLKLSRGLFDQMFDDGPFARAVARGLGVQLQGSRRFDQAVQKSAGAKTIVIVRRRHDQRAAVLESELVRTMATLRNVVSLDRRRIRELAGDVDLGAGLARVLDRVESLHELVLLSAPAPSEDDWLRCCVRQADRVVAIVDGDGEPVNRELLVGCDVVLLDSPERPAIAELLDALAPRSTQRVRRPEDVWRLARRLAERSIGLVLSGGGARGFAHIGVIDELEAAGVTIDRIGGASMGALIGALLAREMRANEIEERCYQEFVRRNPLGDYRFPRTSLIRGARARAMLERNLRGVIEDLPRPYYCVTTDIIAAELVVHRRGELVPAVGASMSIPGVAPPVAIGPRLLVDGGVLDNLPIVPMVEEHEGPIIACDVTQPEQRTLAPGEAPPAIGLIDTLARVMLLGSSDTEDLGRRHADLIITPDRGAAGRLEFHQLDSMVEAGRRAALDALERAPSSIFG